MIYQLGKQKRLGRILGSNGKTFIVPVDDLLICGVDFQLSNYKEKLPLLSFLGINAVLGFPGVFNQFYDTLKDKAWIVNLTTSTIHSNHTHKRLSLSLKRAIADGCDAVAVHVNITSPHEGEMIQNLAQISDECQEYGIPLMAIIYVRGVGLDGKDENYLAVKSDNKNEYANLVSHACRIAVELGVDIIKMNFTGSAESFKRVIYAAGDVPVVIAGGEQMDEYSALNNIKQALKAGASGICFGRNFFYRDNIMLFAQKVSDIINKI
jgi:class I fructose-bisphosphate aldolase/fructose-bisphosphate aldolase/2-amino-3,7-dideoxy-D-threo-hept-6-ulosonate synthase